MSAVFASACAALLLFCAAPVTASGAEISPESVAGQRRPAFDLPDLRGNSVSVSRWNKRVLVLNFWATWCGPCRKEIPLLDALQKNYAGRGVQIVGIAVDNIEAVKQFIHAVPINYPVLIGDQEAIELIEAYGDRAGALPYTVFINRAGIIDSLASGALTEEYARKTIEKLLKN